MAYRSFSDFVAALETAGELRRIPFPVATELEITEISDREMKSPGGGKALLFEKVGNAVRYLEELDDAEQFAAANGFFGMAESIADELDKKIQLLGKTPEELILKLRDYIDFGKRHTLRLMLRDGVDEDTFLTTAAKMVNEAGGIVRTTANVWRTSI